MKCLSKADFEMCQRHYKDNIYYAEKLIETYFEGEPRIKIKKDLKKALKILEYLEKHFDNIQHNYFINQTFIKIYKELGKDKLVEQYEIKYYENVIKKDPSANYAYHYLVNKEIKNAFNYKGKVIDKKMYEKFIEHYLLYLKSAERLSSIIYYINKKQVIDVFTNGPIKKLYIVHLLKEEYKKSSSSLLEQFSKQDYEEYIELLKSNKAFEEIKNFKDYLIATYEYKYNRNDSKSLINYAKYLGNHSKFLKPNIKEAINLLLEAYKKGDMDAVNPLISIYEESENYDEGIKFLQAYLDVNKKDKNNRIKLGELYINSSLTQNNKVTNKTAFKKGIKIYEENFNHLTNDKKDFLVTIYTEGIGVDVDLEKAKQYSQTQKSKEIIINKDLEVLDRIKLIDKEFAPIVNELKQKVSNFDDIAASKLLNIMLKSGLVERDDKLIYDFACFLEKYSLSSAYYAFIKIYSDGIFVEKNNDKVIEYHDKIIKCDTPIGYYFLHHSNVDKLDNQNEVDKILEPLYKAVEANYIPAISLLAEYYYEGKFVEKNKNKGLELYKKIYDEGHYLYTFEYLDNYLHEEYGKVDIQELMNIYKSIADHTNISAVCFLLYLHSKKYKILSPEENFKYLLRSGKGNYKDAFIELCACYKNGIGVKVNPKEAFNWCLKAADTGNKEAKYIIASAYYYGEVDYGVEIDYSKAIKYLNETVNDIRSKYILGKCYFYGQGVEKDLKKAFKYFEDSYNEGYKYSLRYMGYIYEELYGDNKKAFECYKEAAKLGGYEQIALAACYFYGLKDIIEIDYEKAIELYTDIVEKYKDKETYNRIGVAYLRLTKYDEAIKYFNESIKIDKKYNLPYNNLGVVYSAEKNINRDYKKAIEYFELAAKLNYDKANLSIAELYIFNNYGFCDHVKAKPYLDKAVAAKVKGAEVLLAYSYQHHFNDEKEAYRLIKDSKNESSLRYCVLGELYYSGKFLNRDYKEAFKNYQKAYEINDTDPYIWFRLGRCYYFGHGVEKDEKKAYEFINLARNDGFNDAKNFYEEYMAK